MGSLSTFVSFVIKVVAILQTSGKYRIIILVLRGEGGGIN